MKFVLAGFRQDENVRHYSFEGIGDDRRTRTEFSVGVDLSLLHKHGIPLQEAPLMCSLLLTSRADNEQIRSFTFPEDDIRAHAEQRARERAETQTDRKAKSFSPIRPSAALIPIDPRTAPSGIGLGSRVSSSLT